MNADDSYLNERLAERRHRVRSGMAGVGLLVALGLGLLLSFPAPRDLAPTALPTNSASQSAALAGNAVTAAVTALR
jgi:hypothetical protein